MVCAGASVAVSLLDKTIQQHKEIEWANGRLYPPSEVPSVELASDSVTRSPPMTQESFSSRAQRSRSLTRHDQEGRRGTSYFIIRSYHLEWSQRSHFLSVTKGKKRVNPQTANRRPLHPLTSLPSGTTCRDWRAAMCLISNDCAPINRAFHRSRRQVNER